MSKSLQSLMIRSQFLMSTLGTRVAAGFLRNRGVSLQQALDFLVPGAKARAMN